MASVDVYSSKYRSGFGLQAIQDYQGKNAIRSTTVDGMYSYELHIGSKLAIRPGIQASYVARTLNYANLIYPDQYDDDGYAGQTQDDQSVAPVIQYLDLSSGMIMYSDRFWVGYSAHHMNRPNQSFIQNSSRLPMKSAIVGGYKIFIRKANERYNKNFQEVSFTPTVHYKLQGKSDQFDFGVYALYNQIIGGLVYRGIPFKKYQRRLQNNESVVLILGYKYQQISVSYSYDFTVSRLTRANTGGSHELNITYTHVRKKQYKPMRKLPCPSFYEH